MKHPDQDTLLQFALETLETDELLAIEFHLAGCEECSEAVGKIRNELDLIACVSIPVQPPLYPAIKIVHHNRFLALKIAAILVIGFSLGFGTSLAVQPSQIEIVPQRVTLQIPKEEIQKYAAAEPINLQVPIILNKRK